jgi:hypothetical protein
MVHKAGKTYRKGGKYISGKAAHKASKRVAKKTAR